MLSSKTRLRLTKAWNLFPKCYSCIIGDGAGRFWTVLFVWIFNRQFDVFKIRRERI